MELFVSYVQSVHRILIIFPQKEYKMAKEACLMTFANVSVLEMCHRREHDQEALKCVFFAPFSAVSSLAPRACGALHARMIQVAAATAARGPARIATFLPGTVRWPKSNEYRTERIRPAAVSSRRILTRHDSGGFLARAGISVIGISPFARGG